MGGGGQRELTDAMRTYRRQGHCVLDGEEGGREGEIERERDDNRRGEDIYKIGALGGSGDRERES